MLIFDEVITGFRHALGGYQSLAGVTPDLTTMGKAMGNGWPISRPRRPAELMDDVLHHAGTAGVLRRTFNGHPATAAAALATIHKLQQRARARARLPPRRARATGARELCDALGVPHVVSGFGSVFVTYFIDGPAESYDDLLRNNIELFVGYRRELMKHGIFELPLNLKRSHISYAHTDADFDRLIASTEAAVTRALQKAGGL